MTALTLATASVIVDVALERGRSMDLKPLTVAVLDAGGHLVAFKREDSSGILRPQIAVGKAWGVLGMGIGGRDLAKRAETHPTFFAALSDASGGRIFPVPGGVLIRNERKEIIGSVGISGDLPQNDEACAVAGIEKTGMLADPGQGA
ncbi:MAG TPA: heme-binding protein [Casimicrobiaceae bacterium]|nr:heme-binding protein [Casimicrobiaceae bacterium]